MINAEMRTYNYFAFGEPNAYGQRTLSADPVGTVRIAINITSQTIQDNINYKEASYIGLTYALLDDTAVIEYGDKKLKVLYVNPKGRLKQVFLAEL